MSEPTLAGEIEKQRAAFVGLTDEHSIGYRNGLAWAASLAYQFDAHGAAVEAALFAAIDDDSWDEAHGSVRNYRAALDRISAAAQAVRHAVAPAVSAVPEAQGETCGHPNHGNEDHDCWPFLSDAPPVVPEAQDGRGVVWADQIPETGWQWCPVCHCEFPHHFEGCPAPAVTAVPAEEVIHLAMQRGPFAWVCVCEAAYAVVSQDPAAVTCVRCLELQDQFESGAFV